MKYKARCSNCGKQIEGDGDFKLGDCPTCGQRSWSVVVGGSSLPKGWLPKGWVTNGKKGGGS